MTLSPAAPTAITLRRPSHKKPQGRLVAWLPWLQRLVRRPAQVWASTSALTGQIVERPLPKLLPSQPATNPESWKIVADSRLLLRNDAVKSLLKGIDQLCRTRLYMEFAAQDGEPLAWLGGNYGFDGLPLCRLVVRGNPYGSGYLVDIFIYGDDPAAAISLGRLIERIHTEYRGTRSTINPRLPAVA